MLVSPSGLTARRPSTTALGVTFGLYSSQRPPLPNGQRAGLEQVLVRDLEPFGEQLLSGEQVLIALGRFEDFLLVLVQVALEQRRADVGNFQLGDVVAAEKLQRVERLLQLLGMGFGFFQLG